MNARYDVRRAVCTRFSLRGCGHLCAAPGQWQPAMGQPPPHPSASRPAACAPCPSFQSSQSVPAGKYHQYLQRVPMVYRSGEDTQIVLDLPRTSPQHTYPQLLIPRLGRVLHAYTVRSCSKGYCQGMNFIAAVGLSVMTEEVWAPGRACGPGGVPGPLPCRGRSFGWVSFVFGPPPPSHYRGGGGQFRG